MTLEAGTSLGSYEVLSPLGAGGMGEVYRARDSRLGREVAIKVLPEEISRQPERLARFEREARLLAALNHPGIATLHGIEEARGEPFLVMELVEGETLAERLARGPLPLDESLDLARQIAEALEAAHDKGVIHRDLKPANVKVDPDGRVKLLDFGLAKAFADETPESDSSLSPTLSREATQAGVILGTAAYMSPEQAKGRAVDRRSDVFSFGVVLFEMLTGRKAFPGDDVSEILASILKLEPDWAAVPSDLDPRIRLLLRRCLRKDRHRRVQAIGDVRNEIQDVLAEPAAGGRPERAAGWRVALVSALGGAVLAAVAAWTLKPSAPEPGPRAVTRLSVTLPEGAALYAGGSPRRALAVSPDGRRIVYVGRAAIVDPNFLYLRSLESSEVVRIEGTEGAHQPFFSPEGDWLGFSTRRGELKKVRLEGGSPITLMEDVAQGVFAFGAWRGDGRIVYDRGGEGLLDVPAEGGAPVPVTSVEPDSAQEWFPSIDPLTGDLLFVAFDESYGVDPRIERIEAATGERSLLLDDAVLVALTANGYLLFVRDEVLMAAAYDRATHSVGPAVPIPESVARDHNLFPQLAVSNSGALVFVPAAQTDAPTLGWITRGGEFTALGPLPPIGVVGQVQLSPDGRTALVNARLGTERQPILFDLSRGVITRLPGGQRARWHPDGRRVLLSGTSGPSSSLRLLALDTGEEALLLEGERVFSPVWTSDGSTIVYVGRHPVQSIYALRLGEQEPRPVIDTAWSDHSPAVSPDGRWIAYGSEESGRAEVYVARFPDGSARQQISANGAWRPLWSRDGRELFFAEANPDAAGLELRAVPVSIGPDGRLEAGAAQTLFALQDDDTAFMSRANGGAQYDVSPDGSRFLVVRSPLPLPAREIVVVENWLQELERLVPRGP